MELKTISESFPNPSEPVVVSRSHLWVLSHLEALQAKLRYTIRPIHSNEIIECKALHKEWFPIEYSDQFYSMIPYPLQALAAVVQTGDYDDIDSGNIIIGLILFRTESAESSFLRVTFMFTSCPALYIVTLGVVTPLRKLGVAQDMLRQLQSRCAEDVPRPVYLYLHVAAYNTSAIRFYEAAGFTRHEELTNHYLIKGRRYSAYVYVYYIFDGKPPLFTIDNISWLFCQVARVPSWLHW